MPSRFGVLGGSRRVQEGPQEVPQGPGRLLRVPGRASGRGEGGRGRVAEGLKEAGPANSRGGALPEAGQLGCPVPDRGSTGRVNRLIFRGPDGPNRD